MAKLIVDYDYMSFLVSSIDYDYSKTVIDCNRLRLTITPCLVEMLTYDAMLRKHEEKYL